MTSRSDLYGEVEIEVRVGVGLEDQAAGQLLFDGELLTTGHGSLVGNSWRPHPAARARLPEPLGRCR
jgi:hypothetical protein